MLETEYTSSLEEQSSIEDSKFLESSTHTNTSSLQHTNALPGRRRAHTLESLPEDPPEQRNPTNTAIDGQSVEEDATHRYDK